MSYIEFATRRGESVRVSGAERAHLKIISEGAAPENWLRAHGIPDVPMKVKLRPGWGVEDLLSHLRYGWGQVFEGVDSFTLLLNTALRSNPSPALRLATRLHGQCELHAWVAGRDRPWLADIITSGLNEGIFREGMGWDRVIDLLTNGGRGAVVTSHSVCDTFRWDNPLPRKGRLQLTPDDWDDFYFGDGRALQDLGKGMA